VIPAVSAKQYSEYAKNGHFLGRLIGIAVVTVCINVTPVCVWHCSGYSMHQIASAMFFATQYGSIVSVPKLRTFGVTPAMFAKQYSEHA